MGREEGWHLVNRETGLFKLRPSECSGFLEESRESLEQESDQARVLKGQHCVRCPGPSTREPQLWETGRLQASSSSPASIHAPAQPSSWTRGIARAKGSGQSWLHNLPGMAGIALARLVPPHLMNTLEMAPQRTLHRGGRGLATI